MDVALFEWEDFAPPSSSVQHKASVALATLPRTPWASRLAVFDLETTGIDVRSSRIVTAHVGILDQSGACVERRDWLANPGVEIPEAASAIHGVSTERAVRYGQPAARVVREVVDALSAVFAAGLPVVVYNAPYDFSLLLHECRRHGIAPIEAPVPVIDPLVIDRQLDRYRKGKRTLTVTAAHYGIELFDAHEASSDAIAAGRVAQTLARRFPEELDIDCHELHVLQLEWYLEHATDFERYMRENRDPSFTAARGWPISE